MDRIKLWWQERWQDPYFVLKLMMMMLYVVIVLCILVLIPAGRAEETPSINTHSTYVIVDRAMIEEMAQDAKGYEALLNVALHEYHSDTETWERYRPPICLAKMEATMREMERYLPRFTYGHSEHLVDASEKAWNEKMDRWNAVKQECWSNK